MVFFVRYNPNFLLFLPNFFKNYRFRCHICAPLCYHIVRGEIPLVHIRRKYMADKKYVYSFEEAHGVGKEILGGKGAG